VKSSKPMKARSLIEAEDPKNLLRQLPPKLLLIDIYGDRDTLRIINDTPANRAAVEEWKNLQNQYTGEGEEPPMIGEFLSDKGIFSYDFSWT